MLEGLARTWVTLILISGSIAVFLFIASRSMKAMEREDSRPKRNLAGPLLLLVGMGAMIGLAFAFESGFMVLGALAAIGAVVYLLYVLPRQRVRRRYM